MIDIGRPVIDIGKTCEALNRYIRPQSFPVAVRMLQDNEELPAKARFPQREFGAPIALCQAIALARRNGWTMALHEEDQCCPHAAYVLGYVPGKGYLDGSCAESAGLAPKERFHQLAKHVVRLDFGACKCLVAAPLEKATFQPDVVIVYGNPAQICMLVQAAVAVSGDMLTSGFSGSIACSMLIARPVTMGTCQVVLAGAGDRYFALTQDHELAFAMPIGQIKTVIEGLEIGNRITGYRYPTPYVMKLQAQLPAVYGRLMELLCQEKQMTSKAPHIEDENE